MLNKFVIGLASFLLATNASLFLPGQIGGDAKAETAQEPDCRPQYKLETIFYAGEDAVQTQIGRLVDSLQYCEISTFKIQGFSSEYNSAVNETTNRFARAVADELRSQGIDERKITTAGPAVTPIFPQNHYGGSEETKTYIEVLLHERHAETE